MGALELDILFRCSCFSADCLSGGWLISHNSWMPAQKPTTGTLMHILWGQCARWHDLKGVIIHVVDYNSATISYITKCCHPAIKKGLYTVLLDSTQWIQQNLPTICTVWVWVLRHVADPSAFAHSSTESVALICDVILTSVRPCPAATTTCHAGYWYRQQFNNTILLRICHALMICI